MVQLTREDLKYLRGLCYTHLQRTRGTFREMAKRAEETINKLDLLIGSTPREPGKDKYVNDRTHGSTPGSTSDRTT